MCVCVSFSSSFFVFSLISRFLNEFQLVFFFFFFGEIIFFLPTSFNFAFISTSGWRGRMHEHKTTRPHPLPVLLFLLAVLFCLLVLFFTFFSLHWFHPCGGLFLGVLSEPFFFWKDLFNFSSVNFSSIVHLCRWVGGCVCPVGVDFSLNFEDHFWLRVCVCGSDYCLTMWMRSPLTISLSFHFENQFTRHSLFVSPWSSLISDFFLFSLTVFC